jgi:rhamnosyltransferase
MDQDSSWESQQLEMYFSRIASNMDPTIVSFSPTPMEPEKNTSVLADIKRKLFHRAQVVSDDNLIVDRVITSGNVISLEAWSEVGRFYEPLFIDEVDYDFCYRLREKGLRIIQYTDIRMKHILGDLRRSFLPRPAHFGVRCYYITRNMLFIKRKYPQYSLRFDYLKELRRELFVNIINLNLKNIIYMYKGWRAFKHNSI